MFKRRREIPTLEKINIVPIMDAIFIFIFFLLFSAQFIKLFEIETEAPIVSEVPSDAKFDDEPLNLILKVYENKVEILTGVDHELKKTFFRNDEAFSKILKDQLIRLRIKFPKEDQAIIAPEASVEYSDIVKIIDIVQTIPKEEEVKVLIKGQDKILKKIFTQIVLESMDEI